jgi:hypothetical protein
MVVRKVKSNDILISFQGPSRHIKLLQLPVNRLIVHWLELVVIRCFLPAQGWWWLVVHGAMSIDSQFTNNLE